MKLSETNSNNEFIVIMSLNELNDFITWKNASQYDIGFNEGWAMAEEEIHNAKR